MTIKRKRVVGPSLDQRRRTTFPPGAPEIPKGFKFQGRLWEQARKNGRPRTYKNTEELQVDIEKYYEWVEDNPLWEYRVVSNVGTPELLPVPKMHAMTVGELCVFLGISMMTWLEWKRNKHEYLKVQLEAEETIRSQKFNGAGAGMLNPGIIARDLGLADKKEVTGANGLPLNPQQGAVVILPAKVSL